MFLYVCVLWKVGYSASCMWKKEPVDQVPEELEKEALPGCVFSGTILCGAGCAVTFIASCWLLGAILFYCIAWLMEERSLLLCRYLHLPCAFSGFYIC